MGLNTRFEKANAAGAATLVDNSGGAATQTIAAIGVAYNQAEVRDAVASLSAQINKLIADSASIRAAINAGE